MAIPPIISDDPIIVKALNKRRRLGGRSNCVATAFFLLVDEKERIRIVTAEGGIICVVVKD